MDEDERTEGERSKIFRPLTFAVPGTATRLADIVTEDNALAWLYHVALALPPVVLLVSLLRASNRTRATMARLAGYGVLAGLVDAFILRDPMAARIPSITPLIGAGTAILIGEWRGGGIGRWRGGRVTGRPIATVPRTVWWTVLTAAGVGLLVATAVSVGRLIWLPPRTNLQIADRISVLRRTPAALDLLPKGELQPTVEYLRDCTQPSDRVLVAWFAAEAYFFSGRGFAAGLPEVFGEHWSGLRYQRRSLDLLSRQSVPVIVTLADQPMDHYEFLWNYVARRYRLAYDGRLGPGPHINIWVEANRPVARRYGVQALPCYAG
jgi:hypothetical protein